MRFVIFVLGCALAWLLTPEVAAQPVDCRIANNCPKPTATPAGKPASRPAPSRPSQPAASRADPCDERWQTALRVATLEDYERFVAVCPQHRNTALAESRVADLRCEEKWETATFSGTLDGFEHVAKTCPDHPRAAWARERIAAIRADPFDIPGLPPIWAKIPREGLTTASLELVKACEAGTYPSCTSLGYNFHFAKDAPSNLLWASALYAFACFNNDATGCNNLSATLANGQGLARDYARSAIFAERACNAGAKNGCINLAIRYYSGQGVDQNSATALSLYERACDDGKAGGAPLGCLYAAQLHESAIWPFIGNVARALQLAHAGLKLDPNNNDLALLRDRLKATPLTPASAALSLENQSLSDQCSKGDGQACSKLAFAFWSGNGAPRDYPRSAALYERACAAGDMESCSELGAYYAGGIGVTQDEKRAVSLYNQACTSGRGIACSSLGTLYKDGRGTPASLVKALAAYERACALKYANGCGFAAIHYLEGGKGVPVDRNRARILVSQGLQIKPDDVLLLDVAKRL